MDKISMLSAPIDFDKSDFFSIFSLAAGCAVLRQERMGKEVIGENGWKIDVRNRRITFGKNTFDCGIIGSEDYYTNTWLWGWAATESGLAPNVFAPARRAKRNIPDCAEITTAKFALDELHSGHNIAMATVGAAEKNVCYYRCPYEGGALFVQIDGLPEEIFERAGLSEIASQIVNIISALYCDHRLLCAGILCQNGYQFELGDSTIAATDGSQTLFIEFENIGGVCKLTGISLK